MTSLEEIRDHREDLSDPPEEEKKLKGESRELRDLRIALCLLGFAFIEVDERRLDLRGPGARTRSSDA